MFNIICIKTVLNVNTFFTKTKKISKINFRNLNVMKKKQKVD